MRRRTVGGFHPAALGQRLAHDPHAALVPVGRGQGVMRIMRQVLAQSGWVEPSDFTPAH